MAKKVTVENLSSEIQKIVNDYGKEVETNVSEVTKAVTKKGAQALKNESLSVFKNSGKQKNGRYGTGWTSQIDEKRLVTVGTIYNSKYPGLPHLLENGHDLYITHANRGGGRTITRVGRVAGKPHIAKVEQELMTEFENSVVRAIQ